MPTPVYADNAHHAPDIVVYHGTAMHLMQLLPVREPTSGLAAATPLQKAYARNIQEAAQVIKSAGKCNDLWACSINRFYQRTLAVEVDRDLI